MTFLNDVTGVSINLGDGANALHLAAGTNSLAALFNIGSISGTSSSDTLSLNQVGNTVVDLGGGSDTLNLTAQSVGVTLVYADNYGAARCPGSMPSMAISSI